MPEQKKHLFISHVAEDAEYARQLASSLKERGATIVSEWDAASGSMWPDALRTQIDSATALILVIPTRRVRNRNNVVFEAGAAKAMGKPVLAVLPPKNRSAPIDLPTDIAGVLVLDADRRSLDSIADTLLQAVPEHYAEAAGAK
jgi:predicted nucleotide-binding protein